MEKELSEITLEKLWELSPIFLVEHIDRWADDYKEIEILLQNLLAGFPIYRISHTGSTTIKGIWVKNIVDVLVEIPESNSLKDMARMLEQNGFIIMSARVDRISLNKGCTKNGSADKVCHIHPRYAGDNNKLYFRDHSNDHPEVIKEYEILKLQLWKQYEHNRNTYTNAETDLISRWTAEAGKEYRGRYRQIHLL